MTRKYADICTEAWLLRGISCLPGLLKLDNQILSYTALDYGNLWNFQLRKLELTNNINNIKQELDEKHKIILFELPMSEVKQAHIPWHYFSGGIKITTNKNHFRFSFARPANTYFPMERLNASNDILESRQSGKAWKKVLDNSQ
ncbi:MAG: hypothetical protein HN826_13185 [Methylococcales bacterium]|jgi:hypothetical protein|nr:hypothetical protein [Methylococcales bacterium]